MFWARTPAEIIEKFNIKVFNSEYESGELANCHCAMTLGEGGTLAEDSRLIPSI